LGFFKIKEEKRTIKDTRAAYKAAGRQMMPVMIEHVGGYPGLPANSSTVVAQGLEKNNIRMNDNKTLTVKSLEWDEKGQRSAGRAAAGAIVGGVLTGGLGLIAGAAIGGKNNDNSLAIMTCTDGVADYTVYFRADAEKYQKLASLL
jgi:hypothetical protein